MNGLLSFGISAAFVFAVLSRLITDRLRVKLGYSMPVDEREVGAK
jgi:hypothetical protein